MSQNCASVIVGTNNTSQIVVGQNSKNVLVNMGDSSVTAQTNTTEVIAIGQSENITVTDPSENITVVTDSVITINESGANEVLTTTSTALEPITALQVVASYETGLRVASSYNIDHIDRLYGIAISSGGIGDVITLVTFGEYTNVAFSFDITKALYLGDNGALIQSEDLVNQIYSAKIATTLTSNKILVNIQEPRELYIN